MSKINTVGELIKTLKEIYSEDEKIFCMWWDRNLAYLGDKEYPDWAWEKALDTVQDGSLDIPSGMIWDTIAEHIQAAIEGLE